MSLSRRKPFNSEPQTVYHMTAEQRACISALTQAERSIVSARDHVRHGVDEENWTSCIDSAIESLNAAKGYCK